MNIPGNSGNSLLVDDAMAKELLSYIHTGKNTSGVTDVKELQVLLNQLTGQSGKDINNKNNPVKVDDAYGYATTLQVRSLAAAVTEKPLLSGNPIVIVDGSASMMAEIDQLENSLTELAGTDSKFSLGRFGDIKSDLFWVSSTGICLP